MLRLQLPMPGEVGFDVNLAIRSFCRRHNLPVFYFSLGFQHLAQGTRLDILPPATRYPLWDVYVLELMLEIGLTFDGLEAHHQRKL